MDPTPNSRGEASTAKVHSLYTALEWEAIRPIFTKLYKEDNKTLKESMRALADEHDFHATEKMYKSRIRKWRLDKNKKREEMEAVIRKAQQLQADNKPSYFLIRGRRVDLESAYNYFKRSKIPIPTVREMIDAPTPEDVRYFTSPPSTTPESSTDAISGGNSGPASAPKRTPPDKTLSVSSTLPGRDRSATHESHDGNLSGDSGNSTSAQLTPPSEPEEVIATSSSARRSSSNTSLSPRREPSAYTSFLAWYDQLRKKRSHDAESKKDDVELESFTNLTTQLLPPYEYRITEHLIESSHLFNNMPTDLPPRPRSDPFINLVWQTRTALSRNQFDEALRRHKQASGMVFDLVREARPTALVDFAHSTISGASPVAIRYAVIPILMDIWNTIRVLHHPRHPLAAAMSAILATFRLGLPAEFRSHLLVLQMKQSLHVTQQIYGKDHEHCLIILFEMHKAFTDLGRFAEAADCCEQLLNADEAAYGMYSFEACADLIRLSRCHSLQGEYPYGARLLENAWKRAGALPGEKLNKIRYDYLRESARVAKSRGVYGEALEIEKQRYSCCQADFGADDWRAMDAEERIKDLEQLIALEVLAS